MSDREVRAGLRLILAGSPIHEAVADDLDLKRLRLLIGDELRRRRTERVRIAREAERAKALTTAQKVSATMSRMLRRQLSDGEVLEVESRYSK